MLVDVLVYSAFSVRHRKSTSSVVGPLINIIGLRGKIWNAVTISDYISQTHQSVLEAQTHQEYPYNDVLAKLGIVPRGRHYMQFLFTFFAAGVSREAQTNTNKSSNAEFVSEDELTRFVLGTPGASLQLGPQLRLFPESVPSKRDFPDLTLFMTDGVDDGTSTDSGFAAKFRYNSDLLDSVIVDKIIFAFLEILESIGDDPRGLITELTKSFV